MVLTQENTLQNCHYGFYFGDYSLISQQGSTLINQHNKWVGNYSGNGVTDWHKLFGSTITNIAQGTKWYYSNTANPAGQYRVSNLPFNNPNHPLRNDFAPIFNEHAVRFAVVFTRLKYQIMINVKKN